MSAEAIHLLGLPKKHSLTAIHFSDLILSGLVNEQVLAWAASASRWENKYAPLRTTNLRLKEGSSTCFHVRNAADGEFKDIRAGNFFVGTDTQESAVGSIISYPFGINVPLSVRGVRDSAQIVLNVENLATANVNNTARVGLICNTTIQKRTAGEFSAGFADITDATRTSKFTFTGFKSASFIDMLKMIGGRVIIPNPTVPASAGATGEAGEISWNTNYFYVCVATNTWKRVAVASW